METSNFIKYLEFITSEIDSFLKRGFIDDDSIIHLTAELKNLKEQVIKSDLPNNFKITVDNINTKYSIQKVERNSKVILIFALTLGTWYIVYYLKQQIGRKNHLIEVRHQISEILNQIRTN